MTIPLTPIEPSALRQGLWRRRLDAGLQAVLMALVFTLFTTGDAQALAPAGPSERASPASALAAPGAARKLVVGSEQDYPPFATGMSDATAGGFTVDLWKAVAAEAGLSYTLRVLPFHQLLQAFKDGKIDVLLNLAQSHERRQFADFTVPHAIVHGAIFVRKVETRIRSEDDLAGKSIIVMNGDVAHDYAVTKGWGKQLVLVDTAAEGFHMLASGQHEALLLSKLVGIQTLQANRWSNVQALEPKLGSPQKFSFAVPKGQSDLLAAINEGLALSKSNGVYNALYDQWLGVYDEQEIGLGDLLKYIVPVVGFFLLLLGYLLYQRQVERTLAHAATAQSRELLLTVIETLPLRVFWKDRELRYLGGNSAFAHDAGLTQPSELIGKDDHQMGWAAQAERYRADDQAVMASGTARLSFDEPQTTPSGQTIWLRRSKVPLKDSTGETVGVLGLYEDTTERHQAEKKLRQLSVAVEQSPAAVVITDLNATIEYVNPRFTAVTGYSAAEAIGQNARMFQSGQTPREVHAELWRQLNCGLAWHGELMDRRKSGEDFWADAQIAPVKDASGAVTHYVALMTDISVRKQLENERIDAASRLQKMASRLPGVVYQFRLRPDGSSCFPYASDAMRDSFRVSPEEVREDASKVFAIFHPDDLAGIVASIQSSAHDLSLWREEFRLKFSDGTVHWMLGSAMPQKEEDGAVLWHGFITDITQRKREEAVFRGLFEQSLFLAGVVDQQGRLIDVNSIALRVAGTSREQVLGQYFPDTPWWSAPQDREKLIECLAIAYTGRPSSFEATHPTLDGGHISVMFSAMPISLEDGIQVAVVGVDITRRKELEDQVRELAFHDPLTKLPNRRLLNDRLGQLMASSKRSNCYGALMFLDLDNFKPLNDLHGHDFGDLLLVEVAQRLLSCVREIDTVARLGGDEFVVMLSDLSADKSRSTEEARLIAEKIRAALAAPYLLTVTREGKTGAAVEHHCSASIGVVLFINHDASQDEILKWADAAMYQAKDAGRNTIRFHDANAAA
ncbi:MAG: PAS domain S-box protein [Rhodoferax sp.]